MDILYYEDVKIRRGGITFITGESGCGKTTLLHILNGVAPVSSGTVRYNGTDIEALDAVELRREALLAGQSVYLFDKTIRDAFKEFYEYRELPCPDDETIRRYLTLCCAELEPAADCTRLSGGERQRVFLAVCLSLAPKALLLDEPTSALDSETADRLLSSVGDFCRRNEITLIIVSHDAALAEKYGDEIIHIGREVRLEHDN